MKNTLLTFLVQKNNASDLGYLEIIENYFLQLKYLDWRREMRKEFDHYLS